VLLIADPEDSEPRSWRRASANSASVTWIDTADFPERIGMIATPDLSHPGWLEMDGQLIDLGAVTAVYRRSPGVFGMDDAMSGRNAGLH